MPKKHRIERRAFSSVARRASYRVHGRCFSLTATPLPVEEMARATCVVSKKVSPKAVVRVRVKRYAREAMRPLIQAKRGVAYIAYAKRDAAAATSTEIHKDIRALFEEAATRGTIRRT